MSSLICVSKDEFYTAICPLNVQIRHEPPYPYRAIFEVPNRTVAGVIERDGGYWIDRKLKP